MASIHLQDVQISFPLYELTGRSLKKRLVATTTGGRIGAEPISKRNTVIHALENITLHFQHGDRVALIGHNGAGKTTLLRVLAGIYEPACGTVDVQGHIAPLFDISLGMEMEATGYDNIILRGLYLGLTRRQIRQRVQEIAEFTELGDFLNLPLRTYSQGMRMRLGFAISTAIEPDILLLDEGLSAGDAAFMAKANERMQTFWNKAAIIVLASHSESLMRRMCNTAVLLKHGQVVVAGDIDHVLHCYQQSLTS
jgi:ABC-2 type transport system ATP-binding protein/lipopolysaccharide transport system ATP-binding protein